MNSVRVARDALLGIAAVILIAGFGATSAGTRPYDSYLMASWMQAIGSIGAIIGAFAVSKSQIESQRRVSAQELVERRNSVIAGYRTLVEHICQQVESLDRTAKKEMGVSASKEIAAFTSVQIDAAADALAQQPLHELGSTNTIYMHTLFLKFARDTVLEIGRYTAPGSRTLNEAESFREHLSQCRSNLTSARRMLLDGLS